MNRFHIHSLMVATLLAAGQAFANQPPPAPPARDGIEPDQLKANSTKLKTNTDRITISTLESYTVTNTFQLWNGGSEPRGRMTYFITESIGWLSISPSSGIVSNDLQTISAVFSAATGATGTFTGTITIDAIDAQTGARALGAPKTISVTFIVGPRKPINFEKPKIRGILYVGQPINVWRGLWQSANRLTFAYQWQMANDRYGNGLTYIKDANGAVVTSTNCVVPVNARAKYLRVKVTATDPSPFPLSTTAYSDFSNARRVNATPNDFDGDGVSDLWLFDPYSGTWKVAFYTNANATAIFGNINCVAVPGDYDGDGKVDPAIYEEGTGLWSVLLSANRYAVASALFGGPGHIAMPADFDGDGKTDPATYNESLGTWSVMMSANSYTPTTGYLGGPGYLPVAGDYDGDGKNDPAVYQPATGLWLLMLSGSGYATAGMSFGGDGFTPAPGDYDGDGKTDIGVYWAAGNQWWVKSSLTGAILDGTFGPSNGAGIPASAYYEHSPQCSPALIYVSNDFMVWCIMRLNLGYRGQSFQFSIERWRVSW